MAKLGSQLYCFGKVFDGKVIIAFVVVSQTAIVIGIGKIGF